MIDKIVVENLVNQFLDTQSEELFVVATDVKAGNRIEILLDKRGGVSIDECVALNRFIENNLDREVEDYELEVGSAGLTSPLKVLRQYTNTVGEQVEVLVKGGTKEKGVLTAADESNIVLTVERMVKPEGSKRKQLVTGEISIAMADVLQTKRVIELKKK